MNRTLLAVVVAAVTVGAQAARADDFDFDDGYGHRARPVDGRHDCGPRPTYAPQGQDFQGGRYELQTQQVWVPGGQQQVWVEGQCWGGGRRHHRRGGQRCTPGHFEVVSTPGHYETTQQWVWVAWPRQHRRHEQYGAGFSVQGANGTFSMSVF